MKLIGIVNFTPDSFSDGGKNFSHDKALCAVEEMIQHGVHVIDVGAESTRPGATEISSEVELNRLRQILPDIVACCKSSKILVSVDTYKVRIAEYALMNGVDIINYLSVGSLETDREMLDLVGDSALMIFSHTLGLPADSSKTIAEEKDPVEELRVFFEQVFSLTKAPSKIVVDPGIGFGKTRGQSWDIICRIDELKQALNQVAICVGHSKKSFIGNLDRASMTLAISSFLASKSVDYLRIHDTKIHKEMLSRLYKYY